MFSPNKGKYGPEETSNRTLLTQGYGQNNSKWYAMISLYQF